MLAASPFRLRLRYLLWPYVRLWLLYQVGVAGLCAALTWWLRPVQSPLTFEEVYWTTVGLSAVVTIAGLFAPLRLLLPIKVGRGNVREVAGLVAFVALAFAAGNVATGMFDWLAPAQRLPSLAALGSYPPARYYLADTARLDTTGRCLLTDTYSTNDKDSRRVRFVALACPVPGRGAVSARPAVFVGYYYSTDTSATASYDWNGGPHFLARSLRQFAADAARPCYYFEHRRPESSEEENITRSIQQAYPNQLFLLLRPVYQPFADRATAAINAWVWSQLIGNALFCLLALLLPLNHAEVLRLTNLT